MKRRQFLAAAGAGVLTVTLAGCSLVPVIPKRPTSTADDALGWIRHENGRYTLWLPSAEMGQQISAAMQGLAAAELGVPPAQVHLQLPSTRHIARVRATMPRPRLPIRARRGCCTTATQAGSARAAVSSHACGREVISADIGARSTRP